MLNGIDPIILFTLKKLVPTVDPVFGIPITSAPKTYVNLPPIPIYLSESLTGLYIDSEDKNIDIQTDVQTLPTGGPAVINQKSIGTTVKINLQASKDSIGLTLLSAMMDLVFDMTTSKEYSITYLHGAVTVFGGLLHSYAINQNANNTLYNITIELINGSSTKLPFDIPIIPKTTATVPGVSA